MTKLLAVGYKYLKAILAALSSGYIYLEAVLGSNFTWAAVEHLTVGQWLNFVMTVLGVGGLTAVVSNGPSNTSKAAIAARKKAADAGAGVTVSRETQPSYSVPGGYAAGGKVPDPVVSPTPEPAPPLRNMAG